MTEQDWEDLFDAIARREPGKATQMNVPQDFFEPANLQRFKDEMDKRHLPKPQPDPQLPFKAPRNRKS